MGCDFTIACDVALNIHFYSHIPCGMWQLSIVSFDAFNAFLLTHPVWDVTNNTGVNLYFFEISTHTSRVGCDFVILINPVIKNNFYSHIPCGMWPSTPVLVDDIHYFYSHIPCGMWLCTPVTMTKYHIFLLTHPVWDVTLIGVGLLLHLLFLLTHPVWDVTKNLSILLIHYMISTHTSRVGCDSNALLF